ncbi:MAG: enoyl-CoA hydratase/carnithine racemase [Paraglaciecola psychrophila]|jgi:enoyl-CoA hydratase/carnithine racemase
MSFIDTGTEQLLCEIRDRVAIVTLNKPHKKNALGDILTPALRAILLQLESDNRVGCLLLTGAGNAFCSGGDVSGMSASGGEPLPEQQRIAELTHKQETLTGRLFALTKPTVAALPGAAAGAGLSLALACDLRVASDKAFVTTAFANIGLSGDYGASWFLPRLVGLARAKEMFFRSERISAQQGLQMGLINRVFSDDSFRQQAFDYARDIANGPAMALRLMKKNLNQGGDQSLSASLALEAQHLIQCAGSDESKEAISAFIEKRPPQFHR